MEFGAYRLMPSLMEQAGSADDIPPPAAPTAGAGRTGAASIAADVRAEAGTEGVAASKAPSVPAEALRAEVAAESREAGRSRSAARTLSSVPSKRKGYVGQPTVEGLTPGGRVQDIALSDDVLSAATALRTRWNGIWRRICQSGVAQAERPLQAMLRLIEMGLALEEQAEQERAA
jgi:hypothetical protein